MRWLVLGLLRGYKRLVSPLLPTLCRFTPTCSVYMADAVQKYGAVRGIWMGARRLLRCHPWGGAGHDPVP